MRSLPEDQDIAKRLSIIEVVDQRNLAIEKYKQAITLIESAEQNAKRAGGSSAAPSWQVDRHYDLNIENIRKTIDRYVWGELLQKSGLADLMDAQAHKEFHAQLENDVPVVTVETILATFSKLGEQREDIFYRGITNTFKGLCRDYKNNDGFRLGRKIVFHYSPYGHRDEQLNDMERAFFILDGKKAPTYVESSGSKLRSMHYYGGDRKVETEYFALAWYKNQNLHVVFRRPDLVVAINKIIAGEYGEVLGERKAKKANGL